MVVLHDPSSVDESLLITCCSVMYFICSVVLSTGLIGSGWDEGLGESVRSSSSGIEGNSSVLIVAASSSGADR